MSERLFDDEVLSRKKEIKRFSFSYILIAFIILFLLVFQIMLSTQLQNFNQLFPNHFTIAKYFSFSPLFYIITLNSILLMDSFASFTLHSILLSALKLL